MTSDHSSIDASTPGESPVYFDAENGVARVVLDRPKSINALSEEVLAALQSCLDDIAANRSIGRSSCAVSAITSVPVTISRR